MSNDENKSLQQNLPLSWEEDSQSNIQEQTTTKKLLLKRAPQEAPTPPLLKKDTQENFEDEEEYRKGLDRMDTIYDKEIPAAEDDGEDYTDEDYPEDWDSEEIELGQEEFADDEDFIEEHSELEDQDDEIEESQENFEDEEDEDEYVSAFEDSGTFTLDENVEDVSDISPLEAFEEAEIEENRVEISTEALSEKNEALEKDTEQNGSSEETEEEDGVGEVQPAIEESVFALKADTYYEVQTENKSEEAEGHEQGEESLEEVEPNEVVQHHEVKSLGTLLQEARLSCSFTIKDAAEATRIKSSYIIALENNEMDELPAKIYVMNYIRQLCREYNIPNEPILEAFERQSDNNANSSDVKIIRVGDEDARKATKPNSKLNALVVGSSLLTLTMLFFVAWYMKWFNPSSAPESIQIEINLEEIRPEVKLPAPELPIPGQ